MHILFGASLICNLVHPFSAKGCTYFNEKHQNEFILNKMKI